MAERSNFLPGAAIGGSLVIVLIHCGAFALGSDQAMEMIRYGGIFAWATLGLWGLGAIAIGLLGAARLRDTRVPVAAILIAAVLPMASAVAGARFGLSRMGAVLGTVDPSAKSALLAAGISETMTLGLMGVVVGGSLLACIAFVVALDGARASQKSRAGAFTLPIVWIVLAGGATSAVATTLGADGLPMPTVALLVTAGTAVFAGLGVDDEEPRRFGGALLVTLIGMAVAYLGAYQARFAEAIGGFRAISMASAETRLAMLDTTLQHSNDAFHIALPALAGPVGAFACVLGLGRSRIGDAAPKHPLAAVFAVVMLLVTMGLAAMSHQALARAIDRMIGTMTLELPQTDVTLPLVRDGARPAAGDGAVVVVGDQIRRGRAVIGPRASLRSREAIRGAFNRGEPLVLLADESLSAEELYVLLEAAADEDQPLYVEAIVRSSTPLEPLRGPLRDLLPPPPAVHFRLEPSSLRSPRVWAHVTREATLLHDGDSVTPISTAGLGEHSACIVADGDVSLSLLLESLAMSEGACLARQLRLEPRGGLTQARIQEVIRSNLRSIRYCYERMMTGRGPGPDFGGRLDVDILIREDGTTEPSVVEPLHPELDACVLEAVGRLRFPAPEGGDVRIRYPFVFRAAGDTRDE